VAENVVAQNVSMYPVDWALVNTEAERMGVSTSAALRFIVRDWSTLKGAILQQRIDRAARKMAAALTDSPLPVEAFPGGDDDQE
jgi:hypothetical protein